MFDLCPFVEKNIIPKSLVLGIFRSFHEFVIHAIEGGYYISTFLDQFFREDMRGHYGFHHPTFIYGYDSGERVEMWIWRLCMGRLKQQPGSAAFFLMNIRIRSIVSVRSYPEEN